MDLDGDPIRYPLLSKKYKVLKNGPLSLALANIFLAVMAIFAKVM
jgi:hypothetical protein